MNEKILGLHRRVKIVAENYRRAEVELIELLSEMDDIKGFREFGYASLYEYCLKELKLSESIALSLIQVARKSKAIPEIKDALSDKSLTLSHAKRIAPVLTETNKHQWIDKAKSLSVRELDKELAREFPKEMAKEEIKYTHHDRADVKLNISDGLLQKLKRVQDILSQKKSKPVKLEEALEALSEEFLDRHDPVVKSKRILEKKAKCQAPTKTDTATAMGTVTDSVTVTETALSSPNSGSTAPQYLPGNINPRKPLPSKLLHAINLRDRGQCTHIQSNGNRCTQRRWLELHHVIARSRGGADSFENLRTLCFAHHRQRHPT